MSSRLERSKDRSSPSPAFKPPSSSYHVPSSPYQPPASSNDSIQIPSSLGETFNSIPNLTLAPLSESLSKVDHSNELEDRQVDSESINMPGISDHPSAFLASPSFVGLSTAFAHLGPLKTYSESMTSLFQSLREKIDTLDQTSIPLAIRSELCCDAVWLSVFCAACLIVAAAAGQSPASDHRWVWVFEAIVLSLWTLLCFIIRVIRKYLGSRRLIMQAQELIHRFETSPSLLEEELNVFRVQVDGSGVPHSTSVVYVFRKRETPSAEPASENVWLRIPSNLIIEGDIVSLLHGQVSPCAMSSLSIPAFEIQRGEPMRHSQSLPIYYFRANETPILTQMDEIMVAQKTQPTLLRVTQSELRKILFWLALAGYAISLAINGIRHLTLSDNAPSWAEMWFVRPVYALLPMVLLWSPFLYETLSAMGSARLLTLIHALKIGQLSSAFQEKTNSFDDENEEALQTLRQHHRVLPTPLLLRFFARMLFNRDPALLHARQAAEIIGSATAVCVIDQVGIISSVAPFPEQIFLPVDAQQSQDHLSGDAAPNESSTSSFDHNLRHSLQLQLSKDQEDMRARFNDASAREFYLSALKPLGLNSLLNSHCQWSRPGTQRCGSPIFELASGFMACKCLLGPEIGFHVDALLENFTPVFELQIFDITFSQHLMCLVVEDSSNALQLLTHGSPDLLIRYCSDFWDGQTIRDFQQQDIDHILSACHIDANYVAYAYRPLSHAMLTAFDPAAFDEEEEESTEQLLSPLLSTSPLVKSFHLASSESTAKHHIYLSYGNRYKPVTSQPILEAVESLLSDQNFIGMVSSTNSPHPDTASSVELLRSAGVRFVWFSPDEKLVANKFASKIGLETDWNCCISLREREDLSESENQGIINDGAPAQLPVGVSQLRRHIAEIDNVPLLVPLFSDCTPESSLEAIKVLQENGEIVCCVGSVFNIANTAAFAQANVSVAWQPSSSRCLLDEPDTSGAIPLLVRRHQNDRGGGAAEMMTVDGISFPSWTSFSAGMTSLPCAAVMHARSHFTHLLDFMQEGRSFNEYTIKVLQLLIACQMTLFLIETLGYCAMLPSILGGFYQLWISWIALPLFVISLLRTDPSQSPMQLYAEKSILHWSVIRRMFFYYFCLYTGVIACIIVLYVWILYDVWSDLLQDQGIQLTFSQLFNFEDTPEFTSSLFYTASAYAQSICTFAFVYYLAFLSSSLVDKKRAWLKFNQWWCCCITFAILITAAFTVIVLAVVDGLSRLHAIHYGTWILLFLFPCCLLLPQFYVHRDYQPWAQEHQLRLRLEFNTKLGMYSPVQSPAFYPPDT